VDAAAAPKGTPLRESDAKGERSPSRFPGVQTARASVLATLRGRSGGEADDDDDYGEAETVQLHMSLRDVLQSEVEGVPLEDEEHLAGGDP
jgi:hypothetical protein